MHFSKIMRKKKEFLFSHEFFIFQMCQRKTCNAVLVVLVFIKIILGIMLLNDNEVCKYITQIGRVSILNDGIFVVGMFFSSNVKNISLIFESIWLGSLITIILYFDPICSSVNIFANVYALIGLVLPPTYILILIETYKKENQDLRLQLAREDIV
jgi:hypothetical protein